MARPREHALMSLAIGGVFTAATKSRLAGLAALATGTLIDIDHFVELGLVIKTGDRDRLILLFHGWEYIVVGGLLLARKPGWAGVAALLSYGLHVTTDHFTNHLGSPKMYSLLYRARHRFRASRMGLQKQPHEWIGQSPTAWF